MEAKVSNASSSYKLHLTIFQPLLNIYLNYFFFVFNMFNFVNLKFL